jgi:hypothetical protein
MKRIITNRTKVYASTDFRHGETCELQGGQKVDIGYTITSGGNEWIEIMQDGKVTGYISGDTRLINPDKCVYIYQNWVDVYHMPDLNSQRIHRFEKYDEIFITEKACQGDKDWYEICDANGNTGYIETDTYLIYPGIKYVVYQYPVDVHELPDSDSTKTAVYYSGHEIRIESLLRNNRGRMWLKIMDSDSGGYISAETQLEEYNSYIERQKKNIKILRNDSNFINYAPKIISIFLIFLGAILLLSGLIMGKFYWYTILLISVGAFVLLFDFDLMEIGEFLRR